MAFSDAQPGSQPKRARRRSKNTNAWPPAISSKAEGSGITATLSQPPLMLPQAAAGRGRRGGPGGRRQFDCRMRRPWAACRGRALTGYKREKTSNCSGDSVTGWRITTRCTPSLHGGADNEPM